MRIYVADDEKLALELLEETICEVLPGEKPVCFSKASDLLEKSEELPPDIVFLDVEMPGMTGIEIAEKLNELNKNINIIFVTGYNEYAKDAFRVFASYYVTKPCTEEDIREALEHLRYKPKEKKNSIRTFGYFDVFSNGTPISFRSEKSKEMLAYLVDREGAWVSRKEMAGILFDGDYSRNTQKELSRVAKRLAEDLEKYQLSDLFVSDGNYRVDLNNISCDLLQWRDDEKKNLYFGEYMAQYSWGEYRQFNKV